MSDAEAIERVDKELRHTLYLLEMGYLNPGLRKAYSNKADWLMALQRAFGVRT